jgi:hypothetical protein
MCYKRESFQNLSQKCESFANEAPHYFGYFLLEAVEKLIANGLISEVNYAQIQTVKNSQDLLHRLLKKKLNLLLVIIFL